MTRRIVAAVVAVALIMLIPAAASADELPEALTRQIEAVYSGEQSVVCATPDGLRSELYEIGQSDGVIVARSSSDDVRTSLVGDATTWAMGDDYEVVEVGRARMLNRAVDVVEIRLEGVVRVVLSVDLATGVVLASDVLNADGSHYCTTRFTTFSPGDPGLAGSARLAPLDAVDELEWTAAREEVLPAEVDRFVRQSMVAGPEDEILSAYYEDGLFSFTLLNSSGPIDVPEMRDAPAVPGESGEYHRRFEVGSVVYAWQSEVGGYVLVGDLPLDLQESVLAALPAPQSSGFFQRLWRGLFD